jgi:uncharacterized protein YndB with AHSA1/START domain
MGNDSKRKQTPVIVKVSRRFNTTAEHAFDAWLDPQMARQFLFTRPGQVVVRAEIDAQVGGSFLFVARRDGKDIEHIGKYLEIDRPRRLVFTLRVPIVWADDNRVSVEIVPIGTGCELTVTHEGVLAEHENRIQSGWTLFLERLETMESRTGSDNPPSRTFESRTTGTKRSVRLKDQEAR